jgi:hypothetical protein
LIWACFDEVHELTFGLLPLLLSSSNSSAPEFIHLISSEANDACEKDQKKTIAPEHVVSALKALGFDTYIDEVEGVLDEHKEHVKVSSQS